MSSLARPVLEVANAGHVRILTLNRPERLNALTRELFDALAVAIEDAARQAEVRCVILTGAGRGFCSGGDLVKNAGAFARDSELPREQRQLPQSLEAEVEEIARWTRAVRQLHDMPKPTIAMINGPCAGAGMSLAGACDLRFSARSAVFVSAFAPAGVSGDLGGTWYWTQILGSAKARELYILSEKLDAETALHLGLVHRLFDDETLQGETMALAQQLAAREPRVHHYLKANLNAAETESIEPVLRQEALNVMLCSGRWAAAERRPSAPQD